jgi:hypothetical protein
VTTPTTIEYWDWNGTILNSPYWNITTFGGSRQDLPLLRGQNYVIAYRSGQMWRQKMCDQRTVSMAMWTAGINQSTGIPSTNQALDFTTNFYGLRSMFGQQGVGGSLLGKLTRRWQEYVSGVPTLIAGTALAEIAGNMSPTMSGRTRADFTVDLLLADPYFYSPIVTSVPIPRTVPTVVFNAGDAVLGYGQAQGNGGALSGFKITLAGPLTNPTLTNQTAGVSFTVNTTIPSGVTLVLDVLCYTAIPTPLGGMPPVLGSISHKGARPWMILLPATSANPTGAQTLVLTTTNSSDTGAVTSLVYQPGYL